MAAATLIVGRIRGVNRPALATVLPGVSNPTILLDIGANADCKPENLLQFGLMGKAYAQAVFGLKDPTVALLNIGEEDSKGSVLAQEANALMRASLPGFVGNAEGRDLLSGEFDVIVTDGFTGNVALKLLEGSTKILLGRVKYALMSSTVKKILAAPLAGSLKSLKNDMDPDQFGGAPLLGVKGVCAIGHGSSSACAIESGILITARAVRNDLTEILTRNIDTILNQDVG
jgi:glycerol-3-phosphate acyltransferase PlsX